MIRVISRFSHFKRMTQPCLTPKLFPSLHPLHVSFLLVISFSVATKGSTISPTKTNNEQGETCIRTKPNLSKQSTALDVLKELNNSNNMASFMSNDDKGVAIVTGGSSGIGLVTVETLSLTGMKVVLCARNVKAAEEAISSFTKKDNIRIQQLDLSDLDNVKRSCQEIIETDLSSSNKNLNVVVNNAGVMAIQTRTETKQGFEMQIGTNHFGHFAFSKYLLPHMKDGSRIVTVASRAHETGSINIDDLNYNQGRKYGAWDAYGQSKLANILFAKGLQDRLKAANRDILSVSLHPGVIKTPLWRHFPKVIQWGVNIFMDKTEQQGAATSVFASLMNQDAFPNGGEYLFDCEIATPNKYATNVDLRNQLWDKTETLIKNAGFNLPDL